MRSAHAGVCVSVCIALLLSTGIVGTYAQTPLQGQIIVNPDHPQWLMRYQGDPFFMCGPGDPEDFLYLGERKPDGTRNGNQTNRIDKLGSTGANCIYLQAVRSHGGDGDSTHNPFNDCDPSHGFNSAILDQWDEWFTTMDSLEIVVFFFFYDDECLIWDTGDSVESDEEIFIHTLVNRLEHHRNLIWVVAEEYEERYSAARVSNIAAQITDADDYGHVIGVHKLAGLDFSEFSGDPNIDQFAIQYSASDADQFHHAVLAARDSGAGERNLNMAEGHPGVFGREARLRSWAIAMGGAYVMHYQWDIAGTPMADLNECGYLVDFMESTGFCGMTSRSDLCYGETDYILALPDSEYILYADQPGDLGITEIAEGLWDLRWFDPVNGEDSLVPGQHFDSGARSFTRPHSIGDETSLHLIRSSLQATVAHSGVPPEYSLICSNHPNPFNPETTIRFRLPKNASGELELSIHDISGRLIRTLLNKDSGRPIRAGGWYEERWDGCDDGGRMVASGVYFSRLKCDRSAAWNKMILIR